MLRDLDPTKNRCVSGVKITLIRSGLRNLKNRIKQMPKDEIESERPDMIVKIVEKILDFNNQNKKGQGLKILTPEQMLTRLPTSLAQLISGNNSEKLKNEIRQQLYSLYRSEKLSKAINNKLMNAI